MYIRDGYILGIDPGNIESAYCITDNNLRPIEFEKLLNEELLSKILNASFEICPAAIAIENVNCFGMPVGKSIFDTCFWIGRFYQAFRTWSFLDENFPMFLTRKDEKLCICNSLQAKDANIRRALADRFAPSQPNFGKGTNKNPGFFHGFSDDIWSAFAVVKTANDIITGDYIPRG